VKIKAGTTLRLLIPVLGHVCDHVARLDRVPVYKVSFSFGITEVTLERVQLLSCKSFCVFGLRSFIFVIVFCCFIIGIALIAFSFVLVICVLIIRAVFTTFFLGLQRLMVVRGDGVARGSMSMTAAVLAGFAGGRCEAEPLALSILRRLRGGLGEGETKSDLCTSTPKDTERSGS